ncbi:MULTISPECIES: OmpH family outer membrane protein [Desulfovibrio]|uniref:Periplasmic chaperone for outer membrane proteins Skp n=3 Tax=Desulfovibrio TaxID=872 RepID=A0AA94HPY3_DESDE|nr:MULTISPECIES: OmpH family outer membrane protein [Desulfovibrio]ATD80360.1 protoporphyrinogen oxidase [Desulfovibrio sp. G11]MDY0203024.1 OmpH family outer membrane protein [Desulfovibrio desulfuricans]SFW11968.1 periplasmic chaperone for outer membrane proteins Skp [Desulfovibrio desulfuricans]SPD35836.1 Outer membrane chaperone protein (OmpH-like) [Desulfovibrio sp. G11]
MTKQIRFAALGLLCILLTGCLNFSDPPKVGIVDVDRVLRESRAAHAATRHLEAVRQRLDAGWSELQKTYAAAPPKEREQALVQGLRALRRQMALEEAAARQVVVNHMLAETARWRESYKAQMVLARNGLLDAAPGMDITGTIMEGMNLHEPAFAALPTVHIEGGDSATGKKPAAPAPSGKQRPPAEATPGSKKK